MKQFKPFQKVAVLSESDGKVYPDIYQREGNGGHHVLGCRYLIKDENITGITGTGTTDPLTKNKEEDMP